jgi:hypothetical protein
MIYRSIAGITFMDALKQHYGWADRALISITYVKASDGSTAIP